MCNNVFLTFCMVAGMLNHTVLIRIRLPQVEQCYHTSLLVKFLLLEQEFLVINDLGIQNFRTC